MAMGVSCTDDEEFTKNTIDTARRSEGIGGYGHHYVGAGRAADDAQAKLVMDEPAPVVLNGLLRF